MWQPLKTHTTYSLLKSTIKPDDLVKKCVQYGYKSLAITELGNLFSSVKVYKKCKDLGVKPILGCEFFISENDCISTVTLLAKNLDGWKSLVKAISKANLPENFNVTKEIPCLTLEKLAEILKGNCIVYCGSLFSHINSQLFTNLDGAILSRDYNHVKSLVRTDYLDQYNVLIKKYKDLFGEENFFLENQKVYNEVCYASLIVSRLVEWYANKNNIKTIATVDPFYVNKEDAEDQRILICTGEEATLQTVETRIKNSKNWRDYLFFQGSNSYLLNSEQIKSLYSNKEIETTYEVSELCSDYNILNNPQIPKFDSPNGWSSAEHLRQLCLEGWKKKVVGKVPKSKYPIYADRVKEEMRVINEFNLASYFLVLEDILSWARNQGWLVGDARGSCGGSLVSHLSGVTNLDPIEHGLLFERFMNEGRMSKDRVSLPDIDCDFPQNKRLLVKEYIENKYGSDKVAQLATFGRLQGKAALKEVLRVKDRCSFDEMNKITKNIPDEAKIADELQQMKEDGEEPTIILWALRDNPEKFKEWCYFDESGKLCGDYAKDFEQAMRLEGLKKSQGKHASGIVIANQPLEEFCPLLYDKATGKHCLGLDMHDAEALGGMKLDVLGLAALDHIMDILDILNTGDYKDEDN